MGARQTALNALIACRKDGAWSNSILKEYIHRDRLDRREAALASRLCYGVLQNRGKLDFYLKQFLTGRLKDLHPVVRDILHIGIYQMYEMDKIPASAAVNESVVLAKRYCKNQRNAPGLVNAVLRNASKHLDSVKQPQALEDCYSHPKHLIELLASYVGEARVEPMLKANNDVPQIVAQVNTLRTSVCALTEELTLAGIDVTPHSWMPDCLVLSGTGDIEQLESFQKGLFYIQDAAAKLCVQCAELPSQDNYMLMDCCAAPGGKSFASAIAMGGKGRIYSCDIHPHKVEIIHKGASRLGINYICATVMDASENNAQWESQMDAVIADVPCSGYGIIRKKPDIRYKDPKSMQELPALQLKILKNQARYVKPGGILMYATCTLVRAENEGVVEAFLKENREFYLEKLPLPKVFPENTTGMLALVPGQYDTDGFFIARMRRKQ